MANRMPSESKDPGTPERQRSRKKFVRALLNDPEHVVSADTDELAAVGLEKRVEILQSFSHELDDIVPGRLTPKTKHRGLPAETASTLETAGPDLGHGDLVASMSEPALGGAATDDDDDDGIAVGRISYKFRAIDEQRALKANTLWKQADVGAVPASPARPSPTAVFPAPVGVQDVLTACHDVSYHRVHHDDPDMDDDNDESDIAKAIMQALRLRRKYMTESKQPVAYNITASLTMLRSHKISRSELHPRYSVSHPDIVTSASGGDPNRSSSADSMQQQAAADTKKRQNYRCYSYLCRSGRGSGGRCLAPGCRRPKYTFEMIEGTTRVYAEYSRPAGADPASPPRKVHVFRGVDRSTWFKDFSSLLILISDGEAKSFAFRRLQYLQKKFQMHRMLNEADEAGAQRASPHRDFYNVRKVDTHIHLSSCMNQKHLLRFMKKKMKVEGDTVVAVMDGKECTLREVCDKLNVSPYDLSIDTLDMHADRSLFHRFDKFNKKYNPVGESIFREIFLKSSNHIDGRYYAEVIKEVADDLEDSKYQHAEPRVSIYGRNRNEWAKLARWYFKYEMSSPNLRWLIQVPRLFNIYAKLGMVTTFEDMLRNVFEPLFEVTVAPYKDPILARFLEEVVGFDSVDDESKAETSSKFSNPTPDKWDKVKNPPYSEYLYYFYTNIAALNNLRASLGLNTFAFRPHSGEAGIIDHLVASFLTSESINHGIVLRKAPVLQYLFYLSQIGLALSPLSNNLLFLDISKNPFMYFFETGMNVVLTTDDPLQFHMSKEPLIEEYSIARQVWKLSAADLCEIAANSIRTSGYSDSTKCRWLGMNWDMPGPIGNDMHLTNVPDIRCAYRYETLNNEMHVLTHLCC